MPRTPRERAVRVAQRDHRAFEPARLAGLVAPTQREPLRQLLLGRDLGERRLHLQLVGRIDVLRRAPSEQLVMLVAQDVEHARAREREAPFAVALPDPVARRVDDVLQPRLAAPQHLLGEVLRARRLRLAQRASDRGHEPPQVVLQHVVDGAALQRLDRALLADRARHEDERRRRRDVFRDRRARTARRSPAARSRRARFAARSPRSPCGTRSRSRRRGSRCGGRRRRAGARRAPRRRDCPRAATRGSTPRRPQTSVARLRPLVPLPHCAAGETPVPARTLAASVDRAAPRAQPSRVAAPDHVAPGERSPRLSAEPNESAHAPRRYRSRFRGSAGRRRCTSLAAVLGESLKRAQAATELASSCCFLRAPWIGNRMMKRVPLPTSVSKRIEPS